MFQSSFYATSQHGIPAESRTCTRQLPLHRRVFTAASQGVAVTTSGVLAQIYQWRVFAFLYLFKTKHSEIVRKLSLSSHTHTSAHLCLEEQRVMRNMSEWTSAILVLCVLVPVYWTIQSRDAGEPLLPAVTDAVAANNKWQFIFQFWFRTDLDRDSMMWKRKFGC